MELINTSQVTLVHPDIPKFFANLLLAMFGMGLFTIGIDQGQLFRKMEGQVAYRQIKGPGFVHKFIHEMCHVSGSLCP
jgi:hypothetical protein